MKAEIPNLDFSPENVVKNREEIKIAYKKLNAMISALDGLSKANQSMCNHDRKTEHYDPGYAGGGYSHGECQDCGAQLF